MTYENLVSAFAGKRVLVTGHSGFKGSWLVCILHSLGAKIIGVSDKKAGYLHDDFAIDVSPLLDKEIICDIADGVRFRKAVESIDFEYCFHLAAQALVGNSLKDPVRTIEVNVMGSANLLSYLSTKHFMSLVFVTSDKCYENQEWTWGYRETDVLGGKDPYSASKAASELIFSCFERSYFASNAKFGRCSVRAGNVIGGGDWNQDRLVPDLIRSAIEREDVKVRSPAATRPWQHVMDPLGAYLLLAIKNANERDFSGSWNVGPASSNPISVLDLAKLLIKQLKVDVNIRSQDSSLFRNREAKLLQLNCDKLLALGWSPMFSSSETLRLTSDWYRMVVFEGGDPLDVTLTQVSENLKRL